MSEKNDETIRRLNAYYWHRFYNIRELEGRDIEPDNDPYGLWVRGVNRWGLGTYVDHFRSGVIPAGFTWRGAPFGGTPAALGYTDTNGSYMWLQCDASPHFLAKAVAGYNDKRFAARMRTGHTTRPGLRIDDGTLNNSAEIYLDPDGVGGYYVTFESVTGGGAPVVAAGPYYPCTEYVTVHLWWDAVGPRIVGYPIAEEARPINITGFVIGPVVAWVPTRIGFVFYANAGDLCFTDVFWNTFT